MVAPPGVPRDGSAGQAGLRKSCGVVGHIEFATAHPRRQGEASKELRYEWHMVALVAFGVPRLAVRLSWRTAAGTVARLWRDPPSMGGVRWAGERGCVRLVRVPVVARLLEARSGCEGWAPRRSDDARGAAQL